MTGPGARIVDRVGVLVLPDTHVFVASLQKYLKRVEHTLKVELPTELNFDGVERDIKKIQAAAKTAKVEIPATVGKAADASAELKGITKELEAEAKADAVDIPVKPTATAKSVAELAAAVKRLQSVGAAEIRKPVVAKVTPKSVASMQTSMVALAALADSKSLQVPLKTKVTVNTVATLAEAIAKVEAMPGGIKVPILPETTTASVGKFAAELTKLKAFAKVNPVKVTVTADTKTILNALKKIRDFRMPKLAPDMTANTRFWAKFAIVATFAIPQVISLVGSMRSLLGITALLPAVLGGATGGIAALAIGMKGITKAFSKNAKKSAAAIKEFGPNTLEMVGAIKKLTPAWKELQKSVRENLFAGVGKTITDLGKTALPDMRKGLEANGTAFGIMLNRFGEAIAAQGKMGTFSKIWGENAKAVTILAGAIKPVVDGILALAGAGSTQLPVLATSLKGMADSFNAWAQGVAKSGQVTQWINNAKGGFLALWGVLQSVWGILSAIMNAAQQATGTTLGGFAQGLKTISDAMNSPAFQAGLTSFFSGVNDGFKSMESSLPAVGQAFSVLGQVIGRLYQAAGPVLASFFTGFANALTIIGPALIPVIDGLQQGLLTAFETLGPVLSEVMTALAPLGPVLGDLFKALGPILAILITLVGSVLKAIAPILVQLVGGVTRLAQALLPILQAILPAVTAVLEWIIGILGGALTGALEGVINIVQGVFDFIAGIWNAFSALFQGDWTGFWNGLGQALSGIWNVILGALMVIWNVGILGAFRSFAALFSGGWSTLWGFVKGLGETGMKLINGAIEGGFSLIKTGVSAAWTFIKGLFTKAWQGLKEAVTTGISNVASAASALKDRVVGAVGDLFGKFKEIGGDIISGMIQGITDGAGSVARAVSGMASRAWEAAKGFFESHSPSKLFMKLGGWITDGLAIGIDRGSGDPASSARNMADTVSKSAAMSIGAVSFGGGSPYGPGGSGGITYVVNGDMYDVGAFENFVREQELDMKIANYAAGVTG